MLILSRRVDEVVELACSEGLVTVRVVGVTGDGRIRLGFTAPKSITIDRREIAENKRRQAHREDY